jgi:hypothetical protein
MATTTNYGWTTPDDTALVKDGAAAIRTLGSSVDTTTKALNPSTTLGDIEYRSSTANTNTRLGIGSSGQYLSVSGGVPAWVTLSAGGMTLISETTASALSSLSLSSIPSTYKQLVLVWSGIEHSAGTTLFNMRFNDVSTSSYATRYFLNQSATDLAQGDGDLYTSVGGTPLVLFGNNTTGVGLYQTASGYLTIDNYASSTKLKTYTVQAGYTNVSVGARFGGIVGTFDSTSAISSIDIFRVSGTATFSNKTNTSIRLYGVS